MQKESGLISPEGKAIASDEKVLKTFEDRITFIKTLMSDIATFKASVIEVMNNSEKSSYAHLEQIILKGTEANHWLNAYLEVIYTQHPNPPKEKVDFIPVPGETKWDDEKFDTDAKKLTELKNMVKHMISRFYSNPPITIIPSESLFGSEAVKKMMETMFWLKEAVKVIE